MTKKPMTKSELIIWLRDAISTEVQKADDEIDMAFVNECSALLGELIGNEDDYSAQELIQKISTITSSKSQPKKKHLFNPKLVAAAICAAIVLLSSCAVIPSLHDYFRSVLKMSVGESFDAGKMTYVNAGKGTSYANMSDLLEKEKLQILYPRTLPENLAITQVTVSNGGNTIALTFSDPQVNMMILSNVEDTHIYKSSLDVVRYNDTDFYLLTLTNENGTLYNAYAVFEAEKRVYSINCRSQDLLIELLKTME